MCDLNEHAIPSWNINPLVQAVFHVCFVKHLDYSALFKGDKQILNIQNRSQLPYKVVWGQQKKDNLSGNSSIFMTSLFLQIYNILK